MFAFRIKRKSRDTRSVFGIFLVQKHYSSKKIIQIYECQDKLSLNTHRLDYRKTMLLNNLGIFQSIFLYLVLQCTFDVHGEDSFIKGNDPSVCKIHARIIKTRYVSYIETYWKFGFFSDKLKERVSHRIEEYGDWIITEICCEGYEHDPSFELSTVCRPVCKSGCKNGTCNNPNLCDCNVGYRVFMNGTTGYSECVPYCESGCRGGRCVSPKVCTCDPGYVLTKDRDNCKPLCTTIGSEDSQDCGNHASCVAPHTCQCEDGYIIDINTSVSKNSSSSVDKPLYSSELDATILPSLATDNKIFTIGSIVCKPVCQPDCPQSAVCIAPNECQCDIGYVFESHLDNDANKSRCLPTCEKNCINAQCSYPNVCTCFAGYMSRTDDNSTCEPICNDHCINAICTLPNHCECNNGYEKLLGSKPEGNICVPSCPGHCLNGNCFAPGVCSCNDGYALIRRTVANETATFLTFDNNSDSNDSINGSLEDFCQPICKLSCPIGSSCIAPDQCQLQLLAKFTDDDCDNNGAFFNENGTCLCNYGWTGSKCNEAIVCGIILTSGNESDEEFTTVKRIYYPNNWDWEGPKCEKECENSILSRTIPSNTSDNSVDCYYLKLFEKTVGLVSTSIPLSEVPNRGNKTLFCFLTMKSSCNSVKSNVMIGITGGSLAFVLIAGCGLCFYLWRRKLRRNSGSDATNTRESNTKMEPLKDIMALYNTEVHYSECLHPWDTE